MKKEERLSDDDFQVGDFFDEVIAGLTEGIVVENLDAHSSRKSRKRSKPKQKL